ncbi:hypothetical protein SBOR_8000 [Sclerotinia borealis F-4128]|uniref:Uncharacterized protein n=1 Tax=Sclerotinia borealis (strain F-4128) TaxID=1432307 RepID=W9C6W0_SCLBF|nr:hypothetical protein SBOR_8000 [Sclerotinia borealis F-4128]
MHLNQFSLLVFATGTGLCDASLLRRTPQPSPISVASTTLQTLTSSPLSPTLQPEVTPPPGLRVAQLSDVLSLIPECNGLVLSASSEVSSSFASNASAQLIFLSTSAAASISIAQASIAAADASASSAIALVQSSASAALMSASAEIISIQASASSQLSAASVSLISAAAVATNSAQTAALALGAAATESSSAIYSQLADATIAVQISKATTLPMTVAVVLIIGISIASSVVSVLVYRLISRKRMRERENRIREGQNGDEGYGGGMEKGKQNYGNPNPGIAYNYPASSRHSEPSVSTSTSNPLTRANNASRYANSQPELGNTNRDYIEGAYERGDEDNYSTHDSIDIEKEIAEMDYQLRMAEAELERRDLERPIRMSDSGLSRSSKSISVLFNPGRVPEKVDDERGRSGSGSGKSMRGMSMGIGERLKSMVMPSYRQSQFPFESSKEHTRTSEREIGDRESKDEEGEEIIFTLDERPPPLPEPKSTHAYKTSDSSVMTLSPSVYDGGNGSGRGKKGKEVLRGEEQLDSPTMGKGEQPFTFSIGKAY